MKQVEVEVTEESLAKYDAEVLARQNRMAAFAAPTAVSYSWHPPKLNPDGSLSETDKAKQEWGSAKQPRSTTGGTGKQGSW